MKKLIDKKKMEYTAEGRKQLRDFLNRVESGEIVLFERKLEQGRKDLRKAGLIK